MSHAASQRWAIAGGLAVAAAYAVVAVVEVIVSKDAAVAIPFAYTAVCIAAPLVVVSRFLDSPRRDEPGGEGSGGNNGPEPSDGGGDDPGSASWWPEFEQEFWAHVDSGRPNEPVRGHGRATPVP